MNIKNVSQRLVNTEAYIKTETSKVSEAGKNRVKDTFENAKGTESQQGKKELSFDEARLAAAVNYNNVGKPATEMIDAEARFKNQPTDKNPYGPGVKGNRKDPLADLQKKVDEQRAQVRAGSQEPTGPNVGAKIDSLFNGNFSVETAGSKKAEEDRKRLRDGATGNALQESANDTVKDATPYGKDMLAKDQYFGSLPSTVTKNKDGTTTSRNEAAWSDDGRIFQFESKTTYDKDGKEKSRTTTLTEYNGTGKVVTVTENTKEKTTETTTTTKTSGETTTKTTTTTTSPDGTKTTTTTEKTTKGGSVKDPGENPGISPEQLGLGGYKSMSPGAVGHRNGSGDGGDIDPDSNATPKGPVFNDAQIHLQEIGKYGMVGQPDQTFHTGGGTGSAGTGQQGGDIDMGPDSPSQGYTGATRTEDPADVNFNVGGEPLVDSKEEKKKAKEEEEKAAMKNFMFRRIQA